MSIQIADQYVKDAVRTEAPVKGMLGRLMALPESSFTEFDPTKGESEGLALYASNMRIPLGILNCRVHHCALGVVTEIGEMLDLFDEILDYTRGTNLLTSILAYDEVCKTRGDKVWSARLASEIGDLFWYSACYVDAVQWSIGATMPEIETPVTISETRGCMRDLRKTMTAVADAEKKWLYYGKEMPIRELLVRAYTLGYILCPIAGLSPTEVKDQNIEKLERRFKLGRFSETLAQNHDSQ